MSTSPEEQIRQADRVGVRLEIMGGVPIWEALRIQQSIRPTQADGACYRVLDVILRFPDGSL